MIVSTVGGSRAPSVLCDRRRQRLPARRLRQPADGAQGRRSGAGSGRGAGHPGARGDVGHRHAALPDGVAQPRRARGQPDQGRGRSGQGARQPRRAHLGGPAAGLPVALQGRDRHLHQGHRALPRRPALLPAPRPPLHHGAQLRRRGRRLREGGHAHQGQARRDRARRRAQRRRQAAQLAPVQHLVPPRPGLLPQGRLRQRHAAPTTSA